MTDIRLKTIDYREKDSFSGLQSKVYCLKSAKGKKWVEITQI